MAGKSTAEVRLGSPKAAGYAFRAPIATALPTDAVAVLPAAFKDQGFVSEDGVVLEMDGKQIKMRDWNGDVVASVEDETSVTVKLTLLQRGEEALKTIYGDGNVQVAAGKVSSYRYTGGVLPHCVWVFEMVDGAGANRLVLGDAQVTDLGGVSFVKKDIQKQEITLEVFRDANGAFFEHFLQTT